jgi:hypothetical protein
MTQLILPACIVLAYAALPSAWGLRAWAATSILAALGYALTPETPFQNQGPFDGLLQASLVWLIILASIGWIVCSQPYSDLPRVQSRSSYSLQPCVGRLAAFRSIWRSRRLQR